MFKKPSLKVLAHHFMQVTGKRIGPDGGLHLRLDDPDNKTRFVLEVGSKPYQPIGVMEASMEGEVEWRTIEFANGIKALAWFRELAVKEGAVVLAPWPEEVPESTPQPSSPRGSVC